MRKKKGYITERVVNIAQLERMLRSEQRLIQSIKAEIKEKQVGDESINLLLSELEEINRNAIDFEFCLERRKTYI